MSKKKKSRKKNPRAKVHSMTTPSPLEVCRTLTDWYLTAVFGFFPLVIGLGTYGYGNIIEAKAWVWLLLTGLWALCLSVYLLCCKVWKQPLSIRFGWIHWAAILFLLVQILSAAMSQYPRRSFLQLDATNTNSVLFAASYVVAFIGISWFGSFRRTHIWALAISTSLSGILSLLQLSGFNPLTMYPEGLNYYNKHVEYIGAFLGTMGNVDNLGAFLCLAIPAVTVYAIRSSEKRDRLLLIPAAVSLYILYRIDVDSSTVGLLGCLVLIIPVVIRDRKRARYAGIGCLAAIIVGLTVLYFWPGTKGFLWEASQVLHGHIKPSFGHDRVEIWMEALRHIRTHPLLGNGPGSGAWLYQSILKVDQELGLTVTVFNTHNVYLGYLVESGILGLIGYLTLIIRAYVGWIHGRLDDAAVALGAGIACYVIQDVFNLGLVTTAPLLWVALGCLVRIPLRPWQCPQETASLEKALQKTREGKKRIC